MRIVGTGAAGHLGSTLVSILRKEGISVRALMLPGDKKAAMRIEALGAQVFFGDMQDIISLRPLFADLAGKSVTTVHCAGIISIATKDDQRLGSVNVGGTANVQRLVYVSSVHAITEPAAVEIVAETTNFSPDLVHDTYAKSKAEATNLVLESAASGLNVSVVHPSGILGPGDYGLGLLTGMVVEFLGGRMPSVRFIVPMWATRQVASLSEASARWRNRPPLFTPYSLYTLGTLNRFSHKKATAELAYNPRSLRETLVDMVASLREQKRV